VHQAAGESLVHQEFLLLAVDERAKGRDGLSNDGFIATGGGDLGYGDVKLRLRGEREAWVGDWCARLLVENGRETLESEEDVFVVGDGGLGVGAVLP
jgi:hypothetical protein